MDGFVMSASLIIKIMLLFVVENVIMIFAINAILNNKYFIINNLFFNL